MFAHLFKCGNFSAINELGDDGLGWTIASIVCLVNSVVTMPHKPGQLHAVSGICADAGANVLAVEHSRFVMDLAASSARLDITIETRDQAHAEAVIKKSNRPGSLSR